MINTRAELNKQIKKDTLLPSSSSSNNSDPLLPLSPFNPLPTGVKLKSSTHTRHLVVSRMSRHHLWMFCTGKVSLQRSYSNVPLRSFLGPLLLVLSRKCFLPGHLCRWAGGWITRVQPRRRWNAYNNSISCHLQFRGSGNFRVASVRRETQSHSERAGEDEEDEELLVLGKCWLTCDQPLNDRDYPEDRQSVSQTGGTWRAADSQLFVIVESGQRKCSSTSSSFLSLERECWGGWETGNLLKCLSVNSVESLPRTWREEEEEQEQLVLRLFQWKRKSYWGGCGGCRGRRSTHVHCVCNFLANWLRPIN